MVGEPFWMRPPPRDYLAESGMAEDTFGTHHGNVGAGEELGLTPLYCMVSSQDDWDRYEGLQWYAASNRARSNPDDPDLPEVLSRVALARERYLRWQRDLLGWAIYLFRKGI